MDKNDLELFKQAISEGLSEKFDSITNECTEEIVCSEKHNIAMRTIVYGKVGKEKAPPRRVKGIIAIFVAIAILLTSCGIGIIFHNQIREAFEGLFVKLNYLSEDDGSDIIEEVYQLGYIPEGYSLKNETITPVCTQYEFVNESGQYLWFEQKLLNGTDFYVDSESGYKQINSIKNYEVYYRYTGEKHVYVWNDSKYSMTLSSGTELSVDELVLILDGVIK